MINKHLFLSILFFFGSIVFAQGQDLTGYKILYKGREISISQLDSLKKVQGSVSTRINVSKKEVTVSDGTPGSISIDRLRQEQQERVKAAAGNPITPFKANDLANNPVSTEALKGKIYVLNFWFVACKPCIMEMPELNELVKKYKDKDVQFIALALDDAAAVRKFLKKKGFDYTQVPNARSVTMKDFNINVFPTHIIVDRQNNISYYTIGYNKKTVSVLDDKIATLLDTNK